MDSKPGQGLFAWPGGARAAISLTYDDALPSQLDRAAPALQRHGFKGSFFICDRDGGMRLREEGWARLAREGHELAGHTISHPCCGARAWLKPGESLEDFDEERLSAEFRASAAWLERLGAPAPHSYAYTCGDHSLGRPSRSYVPLVRQAYRAARGIADRLSDPWTEDLHMVAGIHGDKRDRDGLIAMAEAALQQGSWAVFMFHGIDEGRLTVSAADHEALLAHLGARSKELFVAPFIQVAEWVAAQRAAAL
jgi:peptidoglycan/xylan/chitin deacetylase (PgdA/CDA1 family)